MSKAPWFDEALKYVGQREYPGKRHNPFIQRLWRLIKAPFTDDETPWCAGFVGGCLELVGVKSTRKANARSYDKFGKRLAYPTRGCIVTFWRGSPNGWQGHVGFVAGRDQRGNLMVLGGNQGNAVTIKPFSKERVLSYRWPDGYPIPFDPLPVVRSDGRLSRDES